MNTPSHELVYEVHLISHFPNLKFKKLVQRFDSVQQVGRPYPHWKGHFPEIQLLAIADGDRFSSWPQGKEYCKFYVRVPVGKFEEVWKRIIQDLEEDKGTLS